MAGGGTHSTVADCTASKGASRAGYAFRWSSRLRGGVPVRLPPPHRCPFESTGLSTWKEQTKFSSTRIIAPELSKSPTAAKDRRLPGGGRRCRARSRRSLRRNSLARRRR